MSKADWLMRDFSTGPVSGGHGRRVGLLTLLLLTVCLLAASAVVWASQATLEEVAVAEGRVVPSGRARVLETLDGGIIRDILVNEGETVAAGQILIRIDDTEAAAALGELNAQKNALAVRASRLSAELDDAERVDFSDLGIDPEGPLALREEAIFNSRLASHFGQREVLNAQASQRQREIEETEAALLRIEENIQLLDEEIALKTESEVVPRAQIIPIERELSARKQELDSVVSRREQARAALREAEARMEELHLQRRAEISVERSDTLNQMSIIDESLKNASNVVLRAALKAPVAGVISVLNVRTIGSVVAPGEELLRIVPQEERLQIEARLRPEDVAFVREDLPADVKFTSFDFTIYGSLPGRVVRVGADAEQDEATGQIYFPAIVETDDNVLTRNGETHDIRAGMVATVDVRTGERTVLDYMLKPFRKARLEAFRER